MQFPGISYMTEKGTIPESLILVSGPSGAGKTVYCRQFFEDGVIGGSYCIYISSSLINKQFRNQFSRIEKPTLDQNCMFINPYLYTLPVDNPPQNLSSSSVLYSKPEIEDKIKGSEDCNTRTEHSHGSLRPDKLALTVAE